MSPDTSKYFYPWNTHGFPEGFVFEPNPDGVEIDDETPRDGLQTPAVKRRPTPDEKWEWVCASAELGCQTIDLGLPTSDASNSEIDTLVGRLAKSDLSIVPNVATLMAPKFVETAIGIAQRHQQLLRVCTFIGSSRVRFLAEGWDLDDIVRKVEATSELLQGKEFVEQAIVTEDTTRAHPDDLARIYGAALERGARRVIICDTVGSANRITVRNLYAWMVEFLHSHGYTTRGTGENRVYIDWHGHNDRTLGVANAFEAALMGYDCVHGTMLGIGERVGNSALDAILINLALEGMWSDDLEGLMAYAESVSRITGISIHELYPALGQHANDSATGVHIAAINKAREKELDAMGRQDFEDVAFWREVRRKVYSGVDPSLVGRDLEVSVGPMSGKSNVIYVLREDHGIEKPDPERVARVFQFAQAADGPISKDEVLEKYNED